MCECDLINIINLESAVDGRLYFSGEWDGPHIDDYSCSLDLFLRFLVQLVPYVCLVACRVMSKGQKIYYYYLRESVRRDGAHTRQTGDNDKSRTGGNTVIIIIIVINGRWLMAVHDGCFNIEIIAGCCSRFIVVYDR